jgi:hypothetical protein
MPVFICAWGYITNNPDFNKKLQLSKTKIITDQDLD